MKARNVRLICAGLAFVGVAVFLSKRTWSNAVKPVTVQVVRQGEQPLERSGPSSLEPTKLQVGHRQTRTQGLPHLIPNYYALVIGINQYIDVPAGQEKWQNLKTARNDAQAIGEILENEFRFEVELLLDEKATHSALKKALDNLPDYGERDAVLIYFAGHGFYDKRLDEGYWIPSDAAFKSEGRYDKSRWIENSIVETHIKACDARHVLVVADSCFSGSLFRSSEQDPTQSNFWYQRVLHLPSRYYISSTTWNEEAPDGGVRHNVFASLILQYLKDYTRKVFSAPEMARFIKPKAAQLTGQLPVIGPMKMVQHAGGEFVFIRKDYDFPVDVESLVNLRPRERRGPSQEHAVPFPSKEEWLKDAALLHERGFVKSAQHILEKAASLYDNDSTVQKLAELMTVGKQGERGNGLVKLAARVAEKAAEEPDYASYAKPRILLMIEPTLVGDAGTASSARSLLLGKLLALELKKWEGVQFVKRDNLDQVLGELQLGSSELSDRRAKSEIGKILPASMILIGEVISDKEGEWVNLILEDTETTREFATFLKRIDNQTSLEEIAGTFAGEIIEAIVQFKPLEAEVIKEESDLLQAGVGWFHGATEGMQFRLIERSPVQLNKQIEFSEHEVGKAQIVFVHENFSDLEPTFLPGERSDAPNELWIREIAVSDTASPH